MITAGCRSPMTTSSVTASIATRLGRLFGRQWRLALRKSLNVAAPVTPSLGHRIKQNSSGGKRQILVAETDTENADSIVRKLPLLGSVRIPPLLLYLGEGGRRRPTGGALPLRRCRNIFLGWHPSWRGAWRRKPASTHGE